MSERMRPPIEKSREAEERRIGIERKIEEEMAFLDDILKGFELYYRSSALSENKVFQSLSEDEKKECSDAIQRLKEYFKETESYYKLKICDKVIPDDFYENVMKVKLARRDYGSNGEPDYDAFRGLFSVITEDADAIACWDFNRRKSMPSQPELNILEFPYFAKKFEVIDQAFSLWCKKYNVPTERFGVLNRIGVWNAAAYFAQERYDLVIGVLKRGLPVARAMDFLGGQVGYLEYHRDAPDKKPEFKAIGEHSEMPHEAARILVCEHDTVTGATLTAVSEALREKFQPEQMDVHFNTPTGGGVHSENLRVAMEAGFKRAWNPDDLPAKGFVERTLLVETIAKERLKE